MRCWSSFLYASFGEISWPYSKYIHTLCVLCSSLHIRWNNLFKCCIYCTMHSSSAHENTHTLTDAFMYRCRQTVLELQIDSMWIHFALQLVDWENVEDVKNLIKPMMAKKTMTSVYKSHITSKITYSIQSNARFLFSSPFLEDYFHSASQTRFVWFCFGIQSTLHPNFTFYTKSWSRSSSFSYRAIWECAQCVCWWFRSILLEYGT